MTMLESIAQILSAIKNVGIPTVAGIFVATSLLIFIPAEMAGSLGLLEFRSAYRAYLGVAWICCASLLIVHAVIAISAFIRKQYGIWRFKRTTSQTLSELTREEKEFLRPFIYEDKNTVFAKIYDGIPAGLVGKGLLYRASNISAPGSQTFPFNMQPFAREALRKNRSLLD
jgi:hypothetical protein